uniref:Uncharacterized protein n=1 Tax=Alexandrium monilatum TaxID=311494 RepID=A0A7S4S730_9DINO|mmetsp:Transcript_76678/g.228587  ORF Transcript_76678/g.228587 Transcript_76678/m.228587 type:complete len:354 (-) Transcript_76678:236-1297(-)
MWLPTREGSAASLDLGTGPACKPGWVPREPRRRPKVAAPATLRPLTHRHGELLVSRLCSAGALTPVLDSEQRALPQRSRPQPPLSLCTGPQAAASSFSTPRSSSLPRQASFGSVLTHSRPSSSPRCASPAQHVAASTPGAREPLVPSLRFPLRTQWPRLEIAERDVGAAQHWHLVMEPALSRALPDARCPYPWLDPCSSGPEHHREEPYTFAGFRQGWDHPDSACFERWCEERSGRMKENVVVSVNAANIAAGNTAAGGTSSGCRRSSVLKERRDGNTSARRESPRRSQLSAAPALRQKRPEWRCDSMSRVASSTSVGSNRMRSDGSVERLLTCRLPGRQHSAGVLRLCNSAR